MEGLDALVQWSLDNHAGDVNAVWRKLCLLAHGNGKDTNAPNQAKLFKSDVLRAMQAMDIVPALSKKEREAIFVRLCNGNHGSSVLGVADFRRVMTPRIKSAQGGKEAAPAPGNRSIRAKTEAFARPGKSLLPNRDAGMNDGPRARSKSHHSHQPGYHSHHTEKAPDFFPKSRPPDRLNPTVAFRVSASALDVTSGSAALQASSSRGQIGGDASQPRSTPEQEEIQYQSVSSSAETSVCEPTDNDIRILDRRSGTGLQLTENDTWTRIETPEHAMLESAREEVDTRINQVVERLQDFTHHISHGKKGIGSPRVQVLNAQNYAEQNVQVPSADSRGYVTAESSPPAMESRASSGASVKPADMMDGYRMMLENTALLERALNELECTIHEREREFAWIRNGDQLRQMEQQKNHLEARVVELEEQIQQMAEEKKQNYHFEKGPVSVLTHNTLVDLLEGKGHVSGWREI